MLAGWRDTPPQLFTTPFTPDSVTPGIAVGPNNTPLYIQLIVHKQTNYEVKMGSTTGPDEILIFFAPSRSIVDVVSLM